MSEKTMELMSLSDAANQVGCDTSTLRVAILAGRLEATKIAKTWIVTPTALQEWRDKYWMIGSSRPRNRKKATSTP